MTKDQMRQVIEALNDGYMGHNYQGYVNAIAIMQREVDAPEVERLTEMQRLDIFTDWFSDESDVTRAMQMLTDFEQTTGIAAPQERKPLTDKEIDACWVQQLTVPQIIQRRVIARAIEAAHGIAAPTKDTP